MTHFLIIAFLALLCGAILMGCGAYFAKDEKVVNLCGQVMWVCFYIYMTAVIAFVLSLLASWVLSV